MDQELRICRKCLLELPATEFAFTDAAHTKRKARCRKCEAARVREYYATNPDYRQSVRTNSKRYAEAKPRTAEQQRRYSLKSTYGLTRWQYDSLLELQGGHCALCAATDPGRTDQSKKWSAGHWNVDHDHSTGHVRGLLCHACNTRLGSHEALIATCGEDGLRHYLTRPSPVPPEPERMDVYATARRAEAAPPRYVRGMCSVDGCGRDLDQHGYCTMHWRRFQRGGDMTVAGKLPHVNPQAKRKLSAEDAAAIRASGDTGIALAARYGVTAATISAVRAGKLWKEPPPDAPS